jgi:alanine racemase
LREVAGSPNLRLAGVMTHVAAPDGALCPSSLEQMKRFRAVLRAARAEGILRGWIHASNSASIFTSLRPSFDTVRPGISAYGILPSALPGADSLRPVLSLRSQVVFIKDLAPGEAVGYGSTWRATRTTRVASVPVGYNDGLCWRLSNQAEVLVRGRRAPIVGRVSMDYVTIDVTGIPGVQVGDHVTLIGVDGEQRITVEELARLAGTIPYEITCSVGRRVARVHVGGEEVPIPSQAPPERRAGRKRAAAPRDLPAPRGDLPESPRSEPPRPRASDANDPPAARSRARR